MILCTECYIQQDGKTLMLFRNKKENDINKGKYIGLGGRFEPGESPEECLLREVREEAGVVLTNYRFRGMVTFLTKDEDSLPIYIFVFTANSYEGTINDECDEGELTWIETKKITEIPLWEGDHLLWKWLQADEGFFSAKFVYDGEKLVEWSCEGRGC
ncbi:MAG: 8-oxo-dGTP diphosphatase [Lachnospiraceae bacterium]|jgi:8-oxo-dGTP diphosphatase|nr:8-oxo-dGTP diphosphatase [Lachnospiraceae bacterium]